MRFWYSFSNENNDPWLRLCVCSEWLNETFVPLLFVDFKKLLVLLSLQSIWFGELRRNWRIAVNENVKMQFLS